jgi:hypothetical protein
VKNALPSNEKTLPGDLDGIMRMRRCWPIAVLLAGFSGAALAEGNCPEGYYP